MNVVSSILYFIGEKIQRMNGIEEVRFSPSSGEISLLVAKHNADKPSEPILAQDIVSLPPAGTSLVGVSSEGNVAPITLPLDVSNGGTGVDSMDKLKDAIPYGDYVVSMEKMLDDKWFVKKWKSGLVEMWSRQAVTWNSMSSTNAGGGIRGVTRVDLPIAEIDGTNCITAIANGQTQGTWATANCDWGSTDNKGRLELQAYRVSSQSTTPININVSMYVVAYIPPTDAQSE